MLLEKIRADMKDAMKAREQARLSTLRMIVAAAMEKEVELKRALEDGDVLVVLQNQVKKRKESIEQFKAGGRQDLVDKEEAELKLLEAYLPAGLTEAEVEAAVEEAIRETGAASKKDLGRVMKAVMDKHKGRVDGKVVNKIVAAKLA